jgi:hypothetical protein
MTHAQGRRLWAAAARLPAGGRIVEIGSFRGRSMIVLARAAPEAGSIVAIDPHAGNDRGPQEISGYEDAAALDHEAFNRNLERAGVRDRVSHVRAFSSEAHGDVDGALHRRRPPLRPGSGRHPGLGGSCSRRRHDAHPRLVQLRRRHAGDPAGAGGGPAVALRRPVGVADRVPRRGAVEQLKQLPWFARNVVIKVLITVKLGRLTRIFGHDPSEWPY